MSYLIKDTTRDQRVLIVQKALGISISDNVIPSDDTLKMVKQYINGKVELDEIRENIIKKYK